MNEEILNRLDIVAAKLNVATSALWQAAVKQSMMEGIESLVLVVVFGLIGWISITHAKTIYQRNGEGEYDDVFLLILMMVIIVSGVVCTLQSLYAMDYLVNPEFSAIRIIVNLMKG